MSYAEKIHLTLDGAKYFATSVLHSDPDNYGAECAFKRQYFVNKNDSSYPWVSAKGGAFPQKVYVLLPFAVTVSSFSFRSRAEKISPDNPLAFAMPKFSPTKFDFIGSDDCQKWTTLMHVTDVQWTGVDQEKSWEIPDKQRVSFKCFGFRVLDNIFTEQAAIQDAKLWRGEY